MSPLEVGGAAALATAVLWGLVALVKLALKRRRAPTKETVGIARSIRK